MLNKKGIAFDDFVPFMVALIFFIFVIIFLAASNVFQASSNNAEVKSVKTNIELIGRVDIFLEKKVSFENKEMRMIDWLATLEEDEDEKISFLKEEINNYFNEHYGENKWSFIMGMGSARNRIFSTGDIRYGSNVIQNLWYTVNLPHTRTIWVTAIKEG